MAGKRKSTGSSRSSDGGDSNVKQFPQQHDPLQFKVRARDDQGHYERVQTTVTPDLDTEIKSIVASGKFDFDSVGEFVRWSLVLGADFCRQLNPNYPSQISIIQAIELENARSQARRNFKAQIENSAREAFELVAMGFTGEAAKHVRKILEYVRRLDPDDPWRAVFAADIKKRFGHLLTLGKKASFMPVDDDDIGDLRALSQELNEELDRKRKRNGGDT